MPALVNSKFRKGREGKAMRPNRGIIFLMFAFFLMSLFSEVRAQVSSGPPGTDLKAPKQKGIIADLPKAPEVLTGKLIREAAIGGETTGWALDLDKPLQIEGKILNRITIDPAEWALGDFENKRVKIKGILGRRCVVERGEYWILVVVGQTLLYSDQ